MPPADITLYRDPSLVNVVIKDGPPPVDQSAQVAALNDQISTLSAQLATATGTISTLNAAIANARAAAQVLKDRDAAVVEGQAILDALPTPP